MMETEFIDQLKQHILQNLSNESFGVSELANLVGMSRSNLLRKIQKEKGVSASVFIRQLRLQEAIQLLEESQKTVSEISYQVGFGNPSYFIKCFREQYGYPPGEHKKSTQAVTYSEPIHQPSQSKIGLYLAGGAILIIVVIITLLLKSNHKEPLEKSIAVLPFKNDSNDSSNIYLINGVTEAILNNLQTFKGLKVVSRTSVEKYRSTQLSLPEIAKELNVNYIVEGSGQKVGNKIMLSVQLIEAQKDDHLWGEQYNRNAEDIFKIQTEVAKEIADAIEIIVSPEEKSRIEKAPTTNLLAYDYFLKGLDQLNQETENGLKNGITLLRKAIAEDKEFPRANAALALAYYYLDVFVAQKQYNDSLIYFADKALLYDPHLPQGLNAKALYYLRLNDYDQAIAYLEKALEYNPNSAMVINTLSDLYTNYIPNSKKYLQYALQGLSLDINSHDSLTTSYIYLHISNALVQNGFVNEALNGINKSLEYNPDNHFSLYVKPYIIYAKNKDLNATKDVLYNVYLRDTTRLDVLQELGNAYYYLHQWDESYLYYNKFLNGCRAIQMDLFIHKYVEIADVMRTKGELENADELMQKFKAFIDKEQSIYRNLYWASYYAYQKENSKAIEYLNLFAKEDNIQIWVPLFTPIDPLFDGIADDPGFKSAMTKIKKRFWNNHQKLAKTIDLDALALLN